MTYDVAVSTTPRHACPPTCSQVSSHLEQNIIPNSRLYQNEHFPRKMNKRIFFMLKKTENRSNCSFQITLRRLIVMVEINPNPLSYSKFALEEVERCLTVSFSRPLTIFGHLWKMADFSLYEGCKPGLTPLIFFQMTYDVAVYTTPRHACPPTLCQVSSHLDHGITPNCRLYQNEHFRKKKIKENSLC